MDPPAAVQRSEGPTHADKFVLAGRYVLVVIVVHSVHQLVVARIHAPCTDAVGAVNQILICMKLYIYSMFN